MSIRIDIQQAEKILNQAAEAARNGSYHVSREMETKIEQILGHTHLTYKYMLLTGMLAIAVDCRVHPLSLQAKAPIKGAFDARTLCHRVVVPFEKEKLQERFGGSNEPFSNKPARFTHLSTDNPCRRGSDLITMKNLISVLEDAREKSCEMAALICILNKALTLDSRAVVMQGNISNDIITKHRLSQLIDEILEKSCEGETLALVTAFLLELYASENLGNVTVSSHPTNQSGSSSMEISDLDVFVDNKLILCVEAKDKEFNSSDVNHAVGKVIKNGGKSLVFIEGRHSSTKIDRNKMVKKYADDGFDLSFVHVHDFKKIVIALISSVAVDMVVSIFNEHVEKIRAKDITIQHLNDVVGKIS